MSTGSYYLGADLLNFRFLQTGAHHEARFMADSLYLLAMQMTKNYNKQLSINEIKMIQDATDYIVIFRCLFFLKSPMAAQAPSNDLRAFKNLSQNMIDPLYSKKYGKIGKALNLSILRHTWYFTPQCVIFTLADQRLKEKETMDILVELLKYDVLEVNTFDKERPEPFTQVFPLLKLSHFVSQESYLFFFHLSITKDDILAWKEEGMSNLERNLNNRSFKTFMSSVHQLAVVNDRAERHIKLIQDYIGRTHSEDRLQDTMIVVLDNRRKVSKHATKQDLNNV
nr:uncharacterized protein LOC124808057 isoform X1 [Hydra vulgaris]